MPTNYLINLINDFLTEKVEKTSNEKKILAYEYFINNYKVLNLENLLNPQNSVLSLFSNEKEFKKIFEIYEPLLNNKKIANAFFTHFEKTKRQDIYYDRIINIIIRKNYDEKLINNILNIYEKYNDVYTGVNLLQVFNPQYYDSNFNIKNEFMDIYLKEKQCYLDDIDNNIKKIDISVAMDAAYSTNFEIFKRIVVKTDYDYLNLITKEDYYNGPLGKQNIYFFINYNNDFIKKFNYLYLNKKIPLINDINNEDIQDQMYELSRNKEEKKQIEKCLISLYEEYPNFLINKLNDLIKCLNGEYKEFYQEKYDFFDKFKSIIEKKELVKIISIKENNIKKTNKI